MKQLLNKDYIQHTVYHFGMSPSLFCALVPFSKIVKKEFNCRRFVRENQVITGTKLVYNIDVLVIDGGVVYDGI